MRAPVTIVSARFEDLVAIGLEQLISEDPNLELTETSVELEALEKVLERAGLIVRSREAQWRPSRLQADPLDEAVEWMQSRKRTWEARMDRLDAHLRRKGEQDE